MINTYILHNVNFDKRNQERIRPREREIERKLTKITFCLYHTIHIPFLNVNFDKMNRERERESEVLLP